MSTLKPLSSPTLAEQTAEAIRSRILGGTFTSGERLVETRLAKQLQVSRGPVREALKQLAAEGLVREEPRRGTFVAAPTENDARDLYDLRTAIEARAARLIIEKQDPSALDALHEAMERISAAMEAADLKGLVRSDYEFHETICRASGNRRLHEVFVRNAGVLRVLIHLEEERFYESFEEVERQHRTVLTAIESGDARQAEALIVEHLEGARDRLLSHLKEQRADVAD